MNRVLIVEDDPGSRSLLRAVLERHGYAISEAENGLEALECARANPPQLIVSDIMMPVMDGYALLHHWKADPELRSIPFVIFTARYTSSSDERLGLDLGADAFIVKPTDPLRFAKRIGDMLSKAKQGELSPPQSPKLDSVALLTHYTADLVAKLEHKAKQLDTSLSMARMGVWTWDMHTNDVALEGYGPITALGSSDYPQTFWELVKLVDPEDQPMILEQLERAKAGAPFDVQFRVRLPDSEVHWVAARGRCVYAPNGEPTLLTGLDQDITERKTLEERLRHSQKIEAMGQLAGGIAHDFNNILAAIIGNAELARIYIADEGPVQECITEILRAGQRAKELTQRILTFSRPRALRLQPIHLRPILDEAEHLLRATLPAGVSFTCRADPTMPPVRADATQIHQILLNLVTNAWHALAGRNGRIEANLELVNVGAGAASQHIELTPGPYVRLTVSDNGAGMDAATLEHMFEPFFTTKPQGAGLGLSVVHGIVRSHGGAIFAESESGRGTTFHVYFPACPEGTRVATPAERTSSTAHGHGEQIMYIDDEEPLVYLAVRFLEHAGYRVDGYTRAEEALRAFRARPNSYDVVITDYNMPSMSGMDLAQQMMKIRPGTLIALTTGYLRPAEVEQAYALGIREVIHKPYLIEELDPLVQRMLAEDEPVRRAEEGARVFGVYR